jgi:hypothetical protein
MTTATTTCLAAAALLLGACAATPAEAAGDEMTQSLVLHLGARDSTSAEPVGDLSGGVTGVEYGSRAWGWLGWEAGISYSEQEEFLELFGIEETVDVLEASFGGRATYAGFADAGAGLLPYASVGLSALALQRRESDDSAVGAYAHGGLCYVFDAGLTVGLDLKVLASSSDDLESYWQLTLQLGWAF